MQLFNGGMTRHCFCFPSGSLCIFVSGARSLSPNCVYRGVCVLECGNKPEKSVKMLAADIFEGRIIPLCVSEDNLNYNCIAAQSRDPSQAQTEPCWTRLNQAWTFSTQHALRFKPRLIGPKASESRFPAVTGTGVGKEKETGRKRRKRKQKSFTAIYINPFWINIIPLFSFASTTFFSPFWLKWRQTPDVAFPQLLSPSWKWCVDTINNQGNLAS